MDYAQIASDAKVKARDILRAQAALRIQDRVASAASSLTKAIRHYAKVVVDAVEAATAKAESDQKRTDRRAAFSAAVSNVPGVTVADLSTAAAEIDKERAENDAESAKAEADNVKCAEECVKEAAKRITNAQEALTKATDNLTKLNAGEIKVDKAELDELANRLIEEERELS
jgi:hypothetical protein